MAIYKVTFKESYMPHEVERTCDVPSRKDIIDLYGLEEKDIDFDRYQNYLQAYETFIKGKKTTYNDYKNLFEQEIATILYTEEGILKSETEVNNLSKVKSLSTKW